MPKISVPLFIALSIFAFASIGHSQRYEVGDIVENFTLTDRATNQPVNLYDMEGKVIFLEWFAHWCPFCQAAAADIIPGITDYYNNIGGNPNDIEVMHVALNLQSNAEAQTQDFVNFFGLGLTLNDFNRAVADRFQTGGQPIFAVINGVAESSTHEQWELLYTALGYGSLNAPIQTFRAVIDSVGAAVGDAPMISDQPTNRKVETGTALNLSVTAVSDLPITYQWKFNDIDIPNATSPALTIEDTQSTDAGPYTVAVSNSNGTTLSEIATVEVIPGFLDTLIAQGVPTELRGFSDDPDKDGIINAYEFLSRTDANDPSSGEPPLVEIETIDGDSYLVYTFVVDTAITSIVAQAQFSISPSFETDFLTPVLYAESIFDGLMHYSFRTTTSLEEASQFTRLQMSVNQ
jgi:thiol-disulfide isomerase/thioredoxin